MSTPKPPLYPDLLYLLEQTLREMHQQLLKCPEKSTVRTALTARIDRLTSTAEGLDWPEFMELLEIIATAVRAIRIDVMRDRKAREDAYRAWAQRLRAELTGELRQELQSALKELRDATTH